VSGVVRGPGPAAYTVWTPVEVRYSDLDEQGRANNAVFFTYFEQGRLGYFAEVRRRGRALAAGGAGESPAGPGVARAADVAPGASDDRLELPLIIAEASCVYRRAVASLAPLVVGVRTARLGRASLVMEYAVCAAPDGPVYATGSTTVACVDLATGRPRGLPAWTVAALRQMEPDLG
jgi:acyl-CoA thioester hydrolase